MKVGILGLGLIGGSLAKAYSAAGHTVYACDQDEQILSFAKLGYKSIGGGGKQGIAQRLVTNPRTLVQP